MSDKATDRNAGAVIVFDGICVLCNGWVRFLLRHDRRGRYRYAAMQSQAGRTLLERHGLDPDDPVSFLLVEDGRAWADSAAIIRVLTGLGGPWRAVAIARWLPAALLDPAYRLLARNRYRWFGTTACHVPSPSQRASFLE